MISLSLLEHAAELEKWHTDKLVIEITWGPKAEAVTLSQQIFSYARGDFQERKCWLSEALWKCYL